MRRLIWISTVCKCVSEFTRCPKLPDFTLLDDTAFCIYAISPILTADIDVSFITPLCPLFIFSQINVIVKSHPFVPFVRPRV